MAASRHTYTAIRGALAKAGEAGQETLHSQAIADSTGIAKSTVQRYGRENSPFSIDGRWRVAYAKGVFTVAEREGYKPPDPPAVPDWFALPGTLPDTEAHDHHWDIGQRRALVDNFIADCQAGHIALAPWQRPAVWTEGQRIELLDSMMRGHSIGTITIWSARGDHAVLGRPLPGCEVATEVSWRNHLIVDGQQRATTLVMAARGDLDHWRWNGVEWSTGQGYLTPRIAVLGALKLGVQSHVEWSQLIFQSDHPQARRMYDDSEKIQRTDLHLTVLGGSAAQMVETYRRLATRGSPHSPEDLAVMERWLARHRGEAPPHSPHKSARDERFNRIRRWLDVREAGGLPDQRSARDQLRDLRCVANTLGLYDAADVMRARGWASD